MNNKRIPPAVGEFAVGERGKLLARIAELEGALADLLDCPASVAQATVPRAALKAQPSGVVLPDGWVQLTIEHEPGYPEDVAFGPQRMMDRLKKWLDRYFEMRLNSSPVTDGVVDERAAFEAWHNQAYGPQDKYNPIRSLAYDSAGVGLGYDDTTVMAQFHAFKGALALSAPSYAQDAGEVVAYWSDFSMVSVRFGDRVRTYVESCAPSHGEQVRELPEGFRVMKPTSSIVRPGERWEIYAPCGSGGIVHEDDVTDWVVRKLLDAAAAPSAGSQEQE